MHDLKQVLYPFKTLLLTSVEWPYSFWKVLGATKIRKHHHSVSSLQNSGVILVLPPSSCHHLQVNSIACHFALEKLLFISVSPSSVPPS